MNQPPDPGIRDWVKPVLHVSHRVLQTPMNVTCPQGQALNTRMKPVSGSRHGPAACRGKLHGALIPGHARPIEDTTPVPLPALHRLDEPITVTFLASTSRMDRSSPSTSSSSSNSAATPASRWTWKPCITCDPYRRHTHRPSHHRPLRRHLSRKPVTAPCHTGWTRFDIVHMRLSHTTDPSQAIFGPRSSLEFTPVR